MSDELGEMVEQARALIAELGRVSSDRPKPVLDQRAEPGPCDFGPVDIGRGPPAPRSAGDHGGSFPRCAEGHAGASPSPTGLRT
jgi:hypothetical protein